MNILIPMAGAGSRFSEAGYATPKPLIPVTSLKLKRKVPMVVAATADIPSAKDSQIIYIDRDFHKTSHVEEEIKKYFSKAVFITIDYLTEGQAASSMLAKEMIDTDEELFIGACDNGLEVDEEAFEKARSVFDALVITHTDDANIERNPTAHSWVYTLGAGVERISVKKTVSAAPLKDHALTGAFWFKRGRDFVKACEAMFLKEDKAGGEYYIDNAMNYAVSMGLKVGFLDVKYLCWGTPYDYEIYEKTVHYWKEFVLAEFK